MPRPARLRAQGATPAHSRGATLEVVIPQGLEWHYEQWHLSPLVVHEGLGLISGVTGTREDGTCADDPEVEFAEAFDKLGHVLGAGGMGFGDILEMTTFHIDLRAHLDVFRHVRDHYLVEPWPAWSAIGTTELAVPGPRLEIKVVCRAPGQVGR